MKTMYYSWQDILELLSKDAADCCGSNVLSRGEFYYSDDLKTPKNHNKPCIRIVMEREGSVKEIWSKERE